MPLKTGGSRARTSIGAVLAGSVVLGLAMATASSGPGSEGPGRTTRLPIDGGGARDLEFPPPRQPGSTPGPTVALLALAGGGSATPVAGGVSDIPAQVLAAYRAAAEATAATDPGCHLGWQLLAAIGRIESGHARGGAVRGDGQTITPILGPVLSGGPGVAAVRDTDDGRYDGDPVWDRAVGPMQFIPSSWAIHGRDGSDDGVADPHNVFDATLAAAGYLCEGDRDLRDATTLRWAIYGYNHSWDYVAAVLAWMRAYAEGRFVPSLGTAVGVSQVTAGQPAEPDPVVAARQATTRSPAGGPTAGPAPGAAPGAAPASGGTPSPGSTGPSSPGSPAPGPSGPSESPGPAASPGPEPAPGPSGSPDPQPSPSPSPTDEPTACPTPSPSPEPTTSAQSDPTPSPTQADAAAPGCPSPEPSPSDSPSPNPSP